MSTLVVGATGATGRLLVEQLLAAGRPVRALVRSADRLPAAVRGHELLTVIEAAVLDLPRHELAGHVAGCRTIVSCLGHNLSFRGIFGPPHRLVTETVRRLCEAAADQSIRFVLMNTTANRNGDLDEHFSPGQHVFLGLLRVFLPPHSDNVQAAGFLRAVIGQHHPTIQWVAVRPDALIDADSVSDYTAHPSPTRDSIFDPGRTSRINVAHFMTRLITDDATWEQWRGRMPVIYNAEN